LVLAILALGCSAETSPKTENKRSITASADQNPDESKDDGKASDSGSTADEQAQDVPPGFDHALLLTDCASCHESKRPAPKDGVAHGGGKSCELCHKYDASKTWANVVAESTFDHKPMPSTCVTCHEGDRPSATHNAGQDCVKCHTNPDWSVVKSATASFSHDPKPVTCEGCHNRPEIVGTRAYPNQGPPTGFDAADKTAAGSGHYIGKDCSSCHGTPPEGNTEFMFTHSKPATGFCLPCHFNKGKGEHAGSSTVTLTGFGNCFNCHKSYDKAGSRSWARSK
jgi:hypothetical protein